MSRLRALMLHHRLLAAWLILVTLGVRMVVPAGHMVGTGSGGGVAIQLCSGYGVRTIVVAAPVFDARGHAIAPASDHGPHGDRDGSAHDRAGQPCAFAGLVAPSLSGADPVLLAVALAVVIALGFASPQRAALPRLPFLRPPLRGPPALIA